MRKMPPGIQTMSSVQPSSGGRSSRSVSARNNVMAFNSRRARLRANVPEPLRPARVGVVPAVTGCRWCPRPCRSAGRGNKTDGGAGGNRTTRTPIIMSRPYPATRAYSGANNGAAPHHGSARGVAARSNDRRPVRNGSAPHRDFDHWIILPELVLECGPGAADQSRGWRNHDCEARQTDDDHAGRAVESLWCAATSTNETHHCRLHFQALSDLPAASLMRAARYVY